MDLGTTEASRAQPTDEIDKKWKKYKNRSSFLHERIEHFIADFKFKRNFSRNRANIFTCISIVAGSSLTILLGIKSFPLFSTFDDKLSILALIMSTAITGMNSWIAFADYKWKWIRYRATLSTLYTIRDDLRYLESSGKQLSDDEIDRIFDQLKRAVHETNEEWMSQRGNAISGMNPSKGSGPTK